jgi:hypothetical protein
MGQMEGLDMFMTRTNEYRACADLDLPARYDISHALHKFAIPRRCFASSLPLLELGAILPLWSTCERR